MHQNWRGIISDNSDTRVLSGVRVLEVAAWTFVPSAGATLAVALGLALCGVLVAATAGFVRIPVPSAWLEWLSYVLAVVLLARAIGDFRLVGFFKRERGTRFARLDSMAFAPLCLLLAAGVFLVAYAHRA